MPYRVLLAVIQFKLDRLEKLSGSESWVIVSAWLSIVHCRGDLLHALTLLDEEEDINKVLKYFSYEHFYVIYCKVRSTQHERHTQAINLLSATMLFVKQMCSVWPNLRATGTNHRLCNQKHSCGQLQVSPATDCTQSARWHS